MEELRDKLRERRDRYLLNQRDLEELIAWALDENRDDHEYWEPVSIIQHRLPAVLPRIQQLGRSLDLHERILAATILGQNGVSQKSSEDECVESLLSMLSSETEPGVLCSILYAFGHLENEKGIEAALPFATYSNDDVRRAAVSALSGTEDLRALGALVKLSADSNLDVRNWATFGLGTLSETDNESIRDALANRLSDEDEEVRGEAMVGLAKRGDKRMLVPLLQEIKARKTENNGILRLVNPSLLRDAAEIVVAKASMGDKRLPVLRELDQIGFLRIMETTVEEIQRRS